MLPLMQRTVSAIYVRDTANGNAGIMLDAGEGTWQQMVDHYGLPLAEQLLASLRVIFISHIHLDHNMGLLMLIEKRNEILGRV
jgi:ribonuclease Z